MISTARKCAKTEYNGVFKFKDSKLRQNDYNDDEELYGDFIMKPVFTDFDGNKLIGSYTHDERWEDEDKVYDHVKIKSKVTLKIVDDYVVIKVRCKSTERVNQFTTNSEYEDFYKYGNNPRNDDGYDYYYPTLIKHVIVDDLTTNIKTTLSTFSLTDLLLTLEPELHKCKRKYVKKSYVKQIYKKVGKIIGESMYHVLHTMSSSNNRYRKFIKEVCTPIYRWIEYKHAMEHNHDPSEMMYVHSCLEESTEQ